MKRKFAIIGLGGFGQKLVTELTAMDFEVLAIDHDPAKIESVRDLAAESVILEKIDEDSLEKSGIKDVDVAIVGAAHDIGESILTLTVLKELGVKQVIGRATSQLHARILKRLGADRIVFPEEDRAVRLAHSLRYPHISEYFDIPGPWDLVEIKVQPQSSLAGRSIKEINRITGEDIQILLIEREMDEEVLEDIAYRKRRVRSPEDDYKVREDDILLFFGEARNLEKFLAESTK